MFYLLCYYVGPTATTSAFFGEGGGPIALNGVACTGNELKLVDCPSRSDTLVCSGHGCQCTHRHDAGVKCSMQGGNSY